MVSVAFRNRGLLKGASRDVLKTIEFQIGEVNLVGTTQSYLVRWSTIIETDIFHLVTLYMCHLELMVRNAACSPRRQLQFFTIQAAVVILARRIALSLEISVTIRVLKFNVYDSLLHGFGRSILYFNSHFLRQFLLRWREEEEEGAAGLEHVCWLS